MIREQRLGAVDMTIALHLRPSACREGGWKTAEQPIAVDVELKPAAWKFFYSALDLRDVKSAGRSPLPTPHHDCPFTQVWIVPKDHG